MFDYALWRETAVEAVDKYPGKMFKTEDIRTWAYDNGVKVPYSHRLWGNVIKEARKRGIVHQVGYATVDNPLAHCAVASVWKKTIKKPKRRMNA